MTGEEVFIHRVAVRPCDVDRMGVVHHSRYAVYFEEARTELLRSKGLTYRDMEEQGVFLVVTDLSVKYRRPARAEDELAIECRVADASYVSISHEYQVRVKGSQETALNGKTRLACVGRDGKVRRLPDNILLLLGVA